jgi:microcystin-dependent protein
MADKTINKKTMENYLGEIKLFAGTFAPVGWAFCNGQTLNITDYEPLFALLGTTYGGNGVNNFALPDLRGQVCVGIGQLIGGQNYTLAQKGGLNEVSLGSAQIPGHNHLVIASPGDATTSDPTNAYLAATNGNNGYSDVELYSPISTGATDISMDDNAINKNDGTDPALPHENMMPYTALNYIIATQGIFPTPS